MDREILGPKWLKHTERRLGRIARSRPENPCLEHRCAENAEILGVLVGVHLDFRGAAPHAGVKRDDPGLRLPEVGVRPDLQRDFGVPLQVVVGNQEELREAARGALVVDNIFVARAL